MPDRFRQGRSVGICLGSQEPLGAISKTDVLPAAGIVLELVVGIPEIGVGPNVTEDSLQRCPTAALQCRGFQDQKGVSGEVLHAHSGRAIVRSIGSRR